MDSGRFDAPALKLSQLRSPWNFFSNRMCGKFLLNKRKVVSFPREALMVSSPKLYRRVQVPFQQIYRKTHHNNYFVILLSTAPSFLNSEILAHLVRKNQVAVFSSIFPWHVLSPVLPVELLTDSDLLYSSVNYRLTLFIGRQIDGLTSVSVVSSKQ